MSEKQNQADILKHLNRLPGHSFDKKQATQYGNVNGFSDLVGVTNGQSVYIEVKDNSKPSKLQIQFLKKKKACGAYGGFARTIQEAIDICSGGFGAEYKKEGWINDKL